MELTDREKILDTANKLGITDTLAHMAYELALRIREERLRRRGGGRVTLAPSGIGVEFIDVSVLYDAEDILKIAAYRIGGE